jgi:2-iminobutanoate/2-iminopropanoate deaminase
MHSNAPSNRAINLPNRRADLPFSDATLAGDTLYIAGRIGFDPSTGVAPPEVERELDFLFSGFDAVLKQAGFTWDDLVWVQIFSTDLTLWEQFNAKYVKYFRGAFPARAYLGSAPLLLNARFEMMGIAVRES